jgi:hypothetical protein
MVERRAKRIKEKRRQRENKKEKRNSQPTPFLFLSLIS